MSDRGLKECYDYSIINLKWRGQNSRIIAILGTLVDREAERLINDEHKASGK